MLKKLSKFRMVLLLIFGAILLSSCAGSDVEEQLEPTVESESFPTGTFFREKGAYYAEYEFLDDGTYTFGILKLTPVVKGEYVVDGQTFTFISETGLGGCRHEARELGVDQIEGSYTWVFEDKVLRFEVDADDCTVRVDQLDGNEYVLIEE
jgi:hypothetical protein